MPNWRQIAGEAKDILTVCLAKSVHIAMSAENGSNWFAAFAEEESHKSGFERIVKAGQTSTDDLDLQALLKIFRFRDAMVEKIFAYYGIFVDLDEFALQNQKQQFIRLMERLTNDFRNGIDAHVSSSDVEKSLAGKPVEGIYSYQQAFEDMCVFIRLFDKVTDKWGVSYASRLISLPRRKKQKKIILAICGVLLAVVTGCGAWLLSKDSDNVYQSQRNPVVTQGQVTAQPIYIHYDGTKLIAECYVINGTDQVISDVDVYSFRMTEGGREIAAANFGVLEGVTLAPGESIKWQFCFPKKTVFDYNAYLPDVQMLFSCRFS